MVVSKEDRIAKILSIIFIVASIGLIVLVGYLWLKTFIRG